MIDYEYLCKMLNDEIRRLNEAKPFVDFHLRDIVNHGRRSYYVTTCYTLDHGFETMVFDMKKQVKGIQCRTNGEADNAFVLSMTDNVDWRCIYAKTHVDKSEARRVHRQVVKKIRETGRVEEE